MLQAGTSKFNHMFLAFRTLQVWELSCNGFVIDTATDTNGSKVFALKPVVDLSYPTALRCYHPIASTPKRIKVRRHVNTFNFRIVKS